MISSIPTPSGSEEIFKKFLKKLIKCEISEDSIGNLIVHKAGNGKKIMIICGIDEDSIIALSQEKDKIYFNHLGQKKLFPGTMININGSEGYICVKDDSKPLDNQYIRMITDDEVPVGTSGIIASEYFEDDSYVKGSRIGRICVINEMINLANEYSGDLDLYIVFEVQSLFNHKGAIVASNTIESDFTIAFEEIESDANNLLLVKASKGYVSSEHIGEFFQNADLEYYVNTDTETTATYIKNSETAVLGIPVKFTNFASSYIYTETREKIKDLFKTIY